MHFYHIFLIKLNCQKARISERSKSKFVYSFSHFRLLFSIIDFKSPHSVERNMKEYIMQVLKHQKKPLNCQKDVVNIHRKGGFNLF